MKVLTAPILPYDERDKKKIKIYFPPSLLLKCDCGKIFEIKHFREKEKFVFHYEVKEKS